MYIIQTSNTINHKILFMLLSLGITITMLLPSAKAADSVAISNSKKHLQKLLLDAASGANKKVKYIISGDSTRENSFNFMIPYYKTQFAKINVTVINNASSGLDAKDWNANKRSYACLKKAIAETSGQGENTIMEYSLGINDQGRKTSREDQKKRYKDGITKYLAAKPKATVILVVPVAHSYKARNIELKEIYTEISNEMNLILIDALKATKDVYGNNKYYHDGTHPNQWGSRRVVNYIMDQILPTKLYRVVTLDEAPREQATDNKELTLGFEKGCYSDSTGHWGAPANYNNAWRLKEIPVEPNFILKIKSGASRNELFFMNNEGKCTNKRYLGKISNGKIVNVVIPPDGVLLRLTLSIDDNYNPANDDISVKYDVSKINYMSIADINANLNLRLH